MHAVGGERILQRVGAVEHKLFEQVDVGNVVGLAIVAQLLVHFGHHRALIDQVFVGSQSLVDGQQAQHIQLRRGGVCPDAVNQRLAKISSADAPAHTSCQPSIT